MDVSETDETKNDPFEEDEEEDDGWGDDDDGDGGDWGTLVDADDAALASAIDSSSTQMDTEDTKTSAPDLSKYEFGEAAFRPLEERKSPVNNVPDICSSIPQIMEASVKGVRGMMSGTRDHRPVIQIIQGIYQSGLFTLGDASSPINQQVVPAIRFIFHECNQKDAKDLKRVSVLTNLAHACEDCQQVQAREILRLYGDLTNQSQTLENQIHYFLLRQKEEALNAFITQFHKDCDLDHTQVKPWQQRAHLVSAYLDMLGDDFGLQGVEAAKGDRFLAQTRQELDNGVWSGTSKNVVLKMLQNKLSLDQFVNYLLADINNQSKNSDRLIDPDCIFKWAQNNMSGEDAHLVFWDEDRAEEYQQQDPTKPLDENKFKPFLSMRVLLQMLVAMGFVNRK